MHLTIKVLTCRKVAIKAYNFNNYKLPSEKRPEYIIYEAFNTDTSCMCKITFDVNQVLFMEMVIDNNDSFLSDALSIMCT